MQRGRVSGRMKGVLQGNLHARWRHSRFKSQHGRCFYCGCEMLQDAAPNQRLRACRLDHRVPLSRGGADHFENTVAACEGCNRLKADRTDVEFRAALASARRAE